MWQLGLFSFGIGVSGKLVNSMNKTVCHPNDLAVGRELQRLRKDAGLSQEDLAWRAHICRTYPSLLERGLRSPTIDVVFKLAKALQMSAGDFVTFIERAVLKDKRRRGIR